MSSSVERRRELVPRRDLKAREVDEEEVRPVRPGVLKPEVIKDGHEHVPALVILCPLALKELLVVGHLKSVGGGLLCDERRKAAVSVVVRRTTKQERRTQRGVDTKDDSSRSGESSVEKDLGAEKPSDSPTSSSEGLCEIKIEGQRRSLRGDGGAGGLTSSATDGDGSLPHARKSSNPDVLLAVVCKAVVLRQKG